VREREREREKSAVVVRLFKKPSKAKSQRL